MLLLIRSEHEIRSRANNQDGLTRTSVAGRRDRSGRSGGRRDALELQERVRNGNLVRVHDLRREFALALDELVEGEDAAVVAEIEVLAAHEAANKRVMDGNPTDCSHFGLRVVVEQVVEDAVQNRVVLRAVDRVGRENQRETKAGAMNKMEGR